MKTAIVHDWLLSPIGGAERVLSNIHELFPSPIFTLLHNAAKLKGSHFTQLDIHPSFLQKIPSIHTTYRNFLPLFPFAIERFNLTKYDLLLSSSHCVAKGIQKTANQLHICYCHTPMRYAWDLMEEYLEGCNLNRSLKGLLLRTILRRLRSWDAKTSTRVDHFIANSQFVARRIHQFYGRSATVIYPPVDTQFYSLKEQKDDFYVTASRLVQNKHVDVIVQAFRQLPHQKLIVIGDGPEKEKLKTLASSNIEFVGAVSDVILKDYLQRAKAFLFASIEDFGIVPVEAMACGTPVIAFKKGGSLETVLDQITGLFFDDLSSSSLCSAIERFETLSFVPERCREQAEKFSQEIFLRQYQSFVLERYEKFQKNL